MKKSYLLFFYCSAFFLSSTAQTINNLYNPDKVTSVLAAKSISLSVFSPKPVISMHYKAPKLPLFCAMEEKSRRKFGFFVKLRAGNDEAYMKMITSQNNTPSVTNRQHPLTTH